MKVIDFRVRIPTKQGIATVFQRSEMEKRYGDVYRLQHEEDLLADSPVLQGRTFKEALDNLFDGPLSNYIKLLDDTNVERVVCTAADARTVGGRYISNDYLASVVKQYPDRLMGLAGVDPYKGMEAVKELERAIKQLGLSGVAFSPWELNLYSNDRKMYPIYAKCVELNVPVMLHCSIHFAVSRPIDFGHPRYLDEVACDFPELKIIANHGGWPWVPELVATAWRHRNVYICFSNIRPRYIGTPNTGWETLMQYGNSIIQDQVIFGTNWPLLPIKRSIKEVMELSLKDSTKEKWLYKNAARVLGLA